MAPAEPSLSLEESHRNSATLLRPRVRATFSKATSFSLEESHSFFKRRLLFSSLLEFLSSPSSDDLAWRELL